MAGLQDDCCPSDGNTIVNNNCSFAANNAIESTFSTNNAFINNILDGSNYGVWGGYSWNDTISRNVMHNCGTAGVAIDHGSGFIISGNTFGKGCSVSFWTDGVDHFPPSQYSCLNRPFASESTLHNITGNFFLEGLYNLVNTTNSSIYNNYFSPTTVASFADTNGSNRYNLPNPISGSNVINGTKIAGNYWGGFEGGICVNHGFRSQPFKQGNVVDWYPLCK
jgi:parallel beta-helix repeat protein